jgi:hypothetical protein
VYVNVVDMEGEYSDSNVTLNALINTKGKGWSTTDVNNTTYTDNGGSSTVASIKLENNRSVTLDINCSAFVSSTTQSKCTTLNGSATSSTNIAF